MRTWVSEVYCRAMGLAKYLLMNDAHSGKHCKDHEHLSSLRSRLPLYHVFSALIDLSLKQARNLKMAVSFSAGLRYTERTDNCSWVDAQQC